MGDMVAQLGDVVAQLVKATGRHQTEDAAVPSSNPAPPPGLLNGARNYDCVSQNKSQDGRRLCMSKKTVNKIK
jgi:hypothetical protein